VNHGVEAACVVDEILQLFGSVVVVMPISG